MSNPQGPGRHSEDSSEQTGEIPAWGAPPPGGWGADDDGWDRRAARGPDDTGWGGEDTGWGAHGGDRYDGDDDEPLWGDEAGPAAGGDGWAVPTGGRRRRAVEEDQRTEAVPAASPSSAWGDEPPPPAHPSDSGWGYGAWSNETGDEPWAPQEAVRKPFDKKLWGLVGGGALVLIVLLVTALLWPGWAISRNLEQTALQDGVRQILSHDYGLQVGAVQCPDDVTVAAGTTFSCQAVVDGEQVEVPGVVTDDDGAYQVNRI